jgi:hypothetical protein
VRDTPSSAATCNGFKYSAASGNVARALAVEAMRVCFTHVRPSSRASGRSGAVLCKSSSSRALRRGATNADVTMAGLGGPQNVRATLDARVSSGHRLGMVRGPPQYLMKFGQAEHMAALFYDGLLYCNTLEYFKDLESNDGTGDPLESATHVYDHTQFQAWILDDDGNKVAELKSEYDSTCKLTHFRGGERNVYCMYGVYSAASTYVDPRNYTNERGEITKPVGVLITNVDEFRRRLEAAVQRDATITTVHARSVEYVSEEFHTGEVGPFRKYARLAYQSEFRLLFVPGDGQPRTVVLGSLEDIAEIGDSRRANDCFSLDHNLLKA